MQQGTLDRRFGRTGRVLTRFASNSAVALAIGATRNGGVVVAGELKGAEGPGGCADPDAHIHLGSAPGFALARYHRDGTLDKTFGGDGRVVATVDQAGLADVLVQPDGMVVVVGSSADRLVLVRYDRSGTLDPSFGSNGDGTVFSDLGGYVGPGTAAVDASGGILVSDSPGCAPCPSSVVRFTRDGRLDPKFGRDGRAFLPTRSSQLHAVAVAPGRRIVAAGIELSPRRRLIVARFSSDGILDPSFGRGGLTRLPVSGRNVPLVNDVAVQKNGQIVVVTTYFLTRVPSALDFTLTRLTATGSVDRRFGVAGKARADFGFADVGEAVAIQSDGRLVVAGVIGDRPGPTHADAIGVARYLP